MSQSSSKSAHSNKGDLTKGEISGHLVRLAVPMTWGIFAIVSFQLIDTFYISMLGDAPLAAVSFTFPITFGVFSLTIGLGIAMSSVLSRQIGEGNMDKVRRLATHGLIISLIVGIAIAVLGMFLINPVFRAMGAPDHMMPMISDYMLIWFAGSVFINTPIVGNAAIRATGDTKVPAMIMTVAALMNVILDPILIFGLFGVPRMELQGAALATVIANLCAMVAGLYVLYVHKKLIFQKGVGLLHFKDSLKRIGFIALPAGLTNTIQPIANAIVIMFLAKQGTDAVAAYGVASRMEAFAFVIMMALATAMGPIIGQNWGAQRFDRVHETLKKSFTFMALWSLFVAVLFILSGKFFASFFSDEAGFLEYIGLYFWIIALSYIPGNLVQGWASAFNAMGKPQRSMLMIVTRMFVLLIPFVMISDQLDGGVAGIFMAIAISNLLSGLGFHLWNRNVCAQAQAARDQAAQA